MNFYKLEKIATQGPIRIERDPGGGVSGVFPTYVLTGNNDSVTVAYGVDSYADAQLLAHCRDNFAKALKQLKWINDNTTQRGCYSELIAELEDVK